eukprot:6199318-Pleurochrysis_carterae.AAC.2
MQSRLTRFLGAVRRLHVHHGKSSESLQATMPSALLDRAQTFVCSPFHVRVESVYHTQEDVRFLDV